jgi:Second Messenger Oligonucleotide or Dinucleotide Synthetase domain
MSVQNHLSSVSGNLVLTSVEQAGIETSKATLHSRLQSYFGSSIREDFKFGSSNRGTILPRKADGKSDVDYMVVFNEDTSVKPQTLLSRLKRFVETKYSTSEVKQSSPTIVLTLNHIHFELVPAVRQGNTSTGSLQIPSSSSDYFDWMTTYPYAADKAIADHNANNGYQSKPLVRLLKFWNAQADPYGRPFSSFEIEQYVTGRSFWLCSNIKDYFYDAVASLPSGWDRAANKRQRIERFKEIVAKAKQLEQDGMPYSAEIEIKKAIPEFS